jgi:hypothetical protein
MQPKNGEQGLPPSNYRALLTKKERNWLLGSLGLNSSKSYEYKLKSTIKKKIQTFVDFELPLLIKNNFVISSETESLGTGLGDRSNYDHSSLGKAKVPGPNPGQGLPNFKKVVVNEEFGSSETLHMRLLPFILCRVFASEPRHIVEYLFRLMLKLSSVFSL